MVFEYFGEMTAEDVLESNREVYGDPCFDDLRWQVVFMDGVESVKFEEQSIKAIAYMDRAAARSNSRIRVAFVGDSALLKELHATYARFVKEEPWPVLRFPSREAAFEHIRRVEPAGEA